MAYTVQLTSGARLTGLASSQACVPLNLSLAQRIGVFDYAINSGGSFAFHNIRNGGVVTLPLSTSTLASVPPGSAILIDEGDGKWRTGNVIADGVSAQVNGQQVDGTARAAVPSSVNGQSLNIPSTTAITFVGVASDGSAWFSANGAMIVCGALTTVAAA